jgi:hypothetical protein
VPNLCLTRAHSSAFQRTKPAWRDRLGNRARVSAVLRVTGFMRQDYPESAYVRLVVIRKPEGFWWGYPGRLVPGSVSSK